MLPCQPCQPQAPKPTGPKASAASAASAASPFDPAAAADEALLLDLEKKLGIAGDSKRRRKEEKQIFADLFEAEDLGIEQLPSSDEDETKAGLEALKDEDMVGLLDSILGGKTASKGPNKAKVSKKKSKAKWEVRSFTKEEGYWLRVWQSRCWQKNADSRPSLLFSIFQSNFGVSSKMLGGWNMLKPQSTVCRLCWFPSTWAPMNQWIELWFCCWLSGQKSCGWFRSFCSHGVAKDASKAGRLPLHRLWISMSLGAQPWNCDLTVDARAATPSPGTWRRARAAQAQTILDWVVCSWIMVNVC